MPKPSLLPAVPGETISIKKSDLGAIRAAWYAIESLSDTLSRSGLPLDGSDARIYASLTKKLGAAIEKAFPPPTDGTETDFEAFFNAYPRKTKADLSTTHDNGEGNTQSCTQPFSQNESRELGHGQ